MKMRILLASIFILLTITPYAQHSFIDSISSNVPIKLISIASTADGGYLMGGHSGSNWSSNMFVQKINRKGDATWSKTYDAGYQEELENMITTFDSGFVLFGTTYDGKYADVGYAGSLLIKCNKNGNIEWKKKWRFPAKTNTFYDTAFYGGLVIESKDGGFITASLAGEFWSGTRYIVVSKLTAQGNVLWSTVQTTPYSFTSAIEALDEAPDGSILIGFASEQCSGFCNRLYLYKLQSTGVFEWEKHIFLSAYQEDDENNHFIGLASDESGIHIIIHLLSNRPYGDYQYSYQLIRPDNSISKADIMDDNMFTLKDYLLKNNINAFKNAILPQTLSRNNGSALVRKDGSVVAGSYGSIFGQSNYVLLKKYTPGNSICPSYTPVKFSDAILKEQVDQTALTENFSAVGLVKLPVNITTGNTSFTFYTACNNTLTAAINAVDAQQLQHKGRGFVVYPNPARDHVTFSVQSNIKIGLLNSTGKLLQTINASGNQRMNTSHLAAGMYYLKNYATGDVQKLIISR